MKRHVQALAACVALLLCTVLLFSACGGGGSTDAPAETSSQSGGGAPPEETVHLEMAIPFFGTTVPADAGLIEEKSTRSPRRKSVSTCT